MAKRHQAQSPVVPCVYNNSRHAAIACHNGQLGMPSRKLGKSHETHMLSQSLCTFCARCSCRITDAMTIDSRSQKVTFVTSRLASDLKTNFTITASARRQWWMLNGSVFWRRRVNFSHAFPVHRTGNAVSHNCARDCGVGIRMRGCRAETHPQMSTG